ncbi:hypothetical protein [Hymenobacter negativus]|uniref:hypothetical protein n=1 Tax=Hymenobacter negativus TaxID=2795026 RepID=UPI001AAE9378|nr:hypothetical protein [Hymenobacter negativus]
MPQSLPRVTSLLLSEPVAADPTGFVWLLAFVILLAATVLGVYGLRFMRRPSRTRQVVGALFLVFALMLGISGIDIIYQMWQTGSFVLTDT